MNLYDKITNQTYEKITYFKETCEMEKHEAIKNIDLKYNDFEQNELETLKINQVLAKEIMKLEEQIINSGQLQKLKKQIETNQIINFGLTSSCLIKQYPILKAFYIKIIERRNKEGLWLYIRTPGPKCNEICINLKDFSFDYPSFKSDKQLLLDVKEALALMNEYLSLIIDYNYQNEKMINQESYNEYKRNRLKCYFTENTINNMTLIRDISSPSHWAWGCAFILFVYKNKLYHFEAYESGINMSIDTTTIRHFEEVQNMGEATYNLPVIKDLKSYVKLRKGPYLLNQIDLEEILNQVEIEKKGGK